MIYKDSKLTTITHSGWGKFEEGFIWSTSKYSSLLIPMKKQSKNFGLQIIVQPFLHQDIINYQEVQLFCNGLYMLGKCSYQNIQEILFVEIHSSLSAFGALKIDLIMPRAESPSNLNISADQRTLGYKLFELQIIG
jgi:hypothetical protein